jgi:hypothetical protein
MLQSRQSLSGQAIRWSLSVTAVQVKAFGVRGRTVVALAADHNGENTAK